MPNIRVHFDGTMLGAKEAACFLGPPRPGIVEQARAALLGAQEGYLVFSKGPQRRL